MNYGTPLVIGITQCYLPPDGGDRPPRLHPNRAGWYLIYRPRKDERLSWSSKTDDVVAAVMSVMMLAAEL